MPSLEELIAGRRKNIETFIRGTVFTQLPTPERLRGLAQYVDIEALRKIENPETIITMFTELKLELLKMADTLDSYGKLKETTGSFHGQRSDDPRHREGRPANRR